MNCRKNLSMNFVTNILLLNNEKNNSSNWIFFPVYYGMKIIYYGKIKIAINLAIQAKIIIKIVWDFIIFLILYWVIKVYCLY